MPKNYCFTNRNYSKKWGTLQKLEDGNLMLETGTGTWTEEIAKIHDLDPQEETNLQLGVSFYKGESKIKIENAIKEAIGK